MEKSISDTDTKLTKDIDDTDTNLRKLVTDTKSELTDAIDSAKTEAIETVLGKNVSADFDTLQEVAEWIQSDTTSSTKLVKRVSALEDDVEQLQEDVQTAQNTADDAYNGTRDNAGRLTSVEAEVKGIEQDYLTSDDYQNLENAIGEVCDIANSAIHNLTTATLLVENWDEETLTQTVTIDGILSDATRQVVNVKPYETSSNLIAKIDDNITAIALSENALTFTVASLPSSEMKFFVEYYPVNYIEEVIPEPEPPAEPEEPETPIEPETISFYLPNGYEFTGEEGMTWEEWVNSEYNTYNAYIQDNEVWFNQFPAPEGQLELPASGKLVDVVASDVIIAEQTYNYE